MAVIQISGLRVERGGKAVLNDLSLTVASGEIYALLGGNGAGKSTTLSTLLGFLKPSSGSVFVSGIDPSADPEAARHKIAYLPENVALYEHLTARENVDYFLALAGETHSLEEVEAAFDAAGLQSEARGRTLSGFSKGMRQKVAIALAVVRQVRRADLDEPKAAGMVKQTAQRADGARGNANAACSLATPAGPARPRGATSGNIALQAFDIGQLQLAHYAVADQRLDVQFDPAAVAGNGGGLDWTTVAPDQTSGFRLGQVPVAKRRDSKSLPDSVTFGGRVRAVDHGSKFLLRQITRLIDGQHATLADDAPSRPTF